MEKTRIRVFDPTTGHDPKSQSFLVLTSYGSGYVKDSLHLFSIFMLAAANSSTELSEETEVEEVRFISKIDQAVSPRQKVATNFNLKLHNPVVTKIVHGVQQTSLFTKTEAHFVIVGALSIARKLPQRDIIIQ